MHLSILLICIMVVRWFGAPRFLQLDAWLAPWLGLVERLGLPYWLKVLMAVAAPVGLAFAALLGAMELGAWLAFILVALLLFYSIGRGDFAQQVMDFTEAVKAEDVQARQQAARALGVRQPAEQTSELYHQVLLAAGYRSLERTFVVLFWFALSGPLLPLAYRLLHLGLAYGFADKPSQRFAKQCLWVFEWPVVRLMSISFALTGNFMSCVQRWQDSLLCFRTPSDKVLGNAIGGALNIDVDCQLGCEDIDKELMALKSLLFRTSLFWLCLLAVYILVLL